MRTARRCLLAATLAAAVASPACKDEVATPTAAGVPLGQEFTLSVGQSASVEGGVRVALRAVREDSRCPVDVQCVWEGDATVAVDVAAATAPAAGYDLHTSGRFAREAAHGPYRITLLGLAPTPQAAAPPAAGDYRATFVVVR